MKVLFLSQVVPYPPHGGVLQRGYHLIRELGRHCEISLLAFVHPDILRDASQELQARQELLRFCSNVEFFRLWPKASPWHARAGLLINLFLREPFSATAHRSREFRDAIRIAVDQFNPDVVHFDTIGLAHYRHFTKGIPAVLTHHNIESQLMRRRASYERNPLARVYLRRQTGLLERWERELTHQFDLNITVSEEDGRLLKALGGPSGSAVVANGVDTGYFSVRREEEGPALIYTGGMNMFANRDAVMFFLREVWPLLVAERPDLTFFAVGQDPPSELQELAESDPRLKVTGFVDDIRPYVAQAAIYVVPLRVGGGTRLKVLDAMAQGKAIVATSIGVEGLFIEPGKHYEVADEPEPMARTILMLLDNPERRRVLGDAARRRAEERYSWERIGADLLSAYRSLTVKVPHGQEAVV